MSKIVMPNEGGCWFCYTDQGTLHPESEFDCYVHLECLQKALKKNPNNCEAKAMSYLLDQNGMGDNQ